jgi:hypothetical protein
LTRLTFLLLLGMLGSGFAQQKRPDFSGTWKLDNAKSAPDAPADRAYLVTVEHAKGNIKVTTRAEGVSNVLDGSFPVSGKSKITKVAAHDYQFTTVTLDPGNTLVFEIMHKDGKGEFAKVLHYVRETWTLSPNGRVLTTFRRTAESGKPIADRKYVLDKQ